MSINNKNIKQLFNKLLLNVENLFFVYRKLVKAVMSNKFSDSEKKELRIKLEQLKDYLEDIRMLNNIVSDISEEKAYPILKDSINDGILKNVSDFILVEFNNLISDLLDKKCTGSKYYKKVMDYYGSVKSILLAILKALNVDNRSNKENSKNNKYTEILSKLKLDKKYQDYYLKIHKTIYNMPGLKHFYFYYIDLEKKTINGIKYDTLLEYYEKKLEKDKKFVSSREKLKELNLWHGEYKDDYMYNYLINILEENPIYVHALFQIILASDRTRRTKKTRRVPLSRAFLTDKKKRILQINENDIVDPEDKKALIVLHEGGYKYKFYFVNGYGIGG